MSLQHWQQHLGVRAVRVEQQQLHTASSQADRQRQPRTSPVRSTSRLARSADLASSLTDMVPCRKYDYNGCNGTVAQAGGSVAALGLTWSEVSTALTRLMQSMTPFGRTSMAPPLYGKWVSMRRRSRMLQPSSDDSSDLRMLHSHTRRQPDSRAGTSRFRSR